jgi:hypothetical protein
VRCESKDGVFEQQESVMATEVMCPPATSVSNGRIEVKDVRIEIDPQPYSANYNRVPFGFTHNLHHLDIFQFDAICDLAAKYETASDSDYFVAGSAISADSAFFAAEHIKLRPRAAIEHLDDKPTRILLKRPENHDPKFRELLETIVEQLRTLPGGTWRPGDQAGAVEPLHYVGGGDHGAALRSGGGVLHPDRRR